MTIKRESDVTATTINMAAEARKAWAEKWNEPEVAYEFSNGRKFYLQTGDAAIYATSPDHNT